MPQNMYNGNAPIHTTCVQPKDFGPITPGLKNLLKNFPHEVGFALLSFVMYGVPGLFGSAVAAVAALHKICDFLLHGKLVCLPGSGCAIGTVVSIETVETKNGFDSIDNDFCFNLMLAPAPYNELNFYTKDDAGNVSTLTAQDLFNKKYDEVKGTVQGHLISEQAGMPEPAEYLLTKIGDHRYDRYHPTYTAFPDRQTPTFRSKLSSNLLWQHEDDPVDEETPVYGKPDDGSSVKAFWVPVLHCEVEGERTSAVCWALDLPMHLLGLSKLCRWKPLGIPVGRYACALVSLAFLPLILAALPIAWAAGSDDNREFRNAGELHAGEEVIVTGHWVYDGGHQGWNEIHPVTNIQRTSELGASRDFEEIRQIWCEGLSYGPPQLAVSQGSRPRGTRSSSGTPEMSLPQRTVYNQQLQPENRWIFHPAVDGCVPQRDAPIH